MKHCRWRLSNLSFISSPTDNLSCTFIFLQAPYVFRTTLKCKLNWKTVSFPLPAWIWQWNLKLQSRKNTFEIEVHSWCTLYIRMMTRCHRSSRGESLQFTEIPGLLFLNVESITLWTFRAEDCTMSWRSHTFLCNLIPQEFDHCNCEAYWTKNSGCQSWLLKTKPGAS